MVQPAATPNLDIDVKKGSQENKLPTSPESTTDNGDVQQRQKALLRAELRETPGFYTRAWRQLRKDKVAMGALVVVVLMLFFSFGAPLVAKMTGYTYEEIDLSQALVGPGTGGHILGTDHSGRDLLTRLAYGGRISMMVSVVALVTALVIGISLGSISGFFGGAIDSILMRLVDAWLSIPGITILLILSVLIRPGPFSLAIIIGVLSWAGITRLIRGEVLALKNRDYIDAARVTGASDSQIIRRHILPNVLSILVVWASLALPGLILTEAGLSYLGFGVQIPTPSWGNMLNESRAYINRSWAFAFFPGFMIFLSALSINLLGNGLRDALDPRLND